jgi:hypothetical protein
MFGSLLDLAKNAGKTILSGGSVNDVISGAG